MNPIESFKRLAGLVLAGGLVWQSTVAMAQTGGAAALTVQTTSAQIREWQNRLPASGTIHAWREASVAAELAGARIVEVHGELGQHVEKGQLLIRLGSDMIEATLAVRRSTLQIAKIALSEAKNNANRARALRGKGVLSDQQIENLLNAERRAKANMQSATATLKLERLRLKQSEIVASDDGVIVLRNARLGSVVQPGVELMRIQREGRLEWRAELLSRQLAKVAVGQAVELKLPSGQRISAGIRKISPLVDAKTGKVSIYVDLPADSPALAGMFVSGEILLGASIALVLPQSGVIYRDARSYVFVVDNNSIVSQRAVTVGRHQDNGVEIVEGIDVSDRVVKSGGAFLSDGDRVRVVDASQ